MEAHDEAEVQRALSAGARIIGVNNRNLKDFTVDIRKFHKAAEADPKGDRVCIGEWHENTGGYQKTAG